MDTPVNRLNFKGLGVISAVVLAYVAIFALSYPLAQYSDTPLLGVIIGGPAALRNLTFSVLGFLLVIKNRREIISRDVLVAAVLAGLVWISVEYRYLFHGWTPIIPFYDPTLNALEAFLMALGSFTLRKERYIKSSLCEVDQQKAGRSLATGFLLGIPFALINLAFFVFLYGQSLGVGDIVYGCVNALRPAIMEEVAYRLFFMGASMSLLVKHVPKATAVRSSVAMAVLFHSLPHVFELLPVNPLMALVTVLISSVLFGLPMAVLAYRRDIEAAISFHWTIDTIRFILVG